MAHQVVYTEIPYNDLKLDLREIVKEELSKQQQKQLEEKLISPEETRKLFSPAISRGTLYNWEQAGLLKKYNLGGRTWYKYSEIMSAATSLKKYQRV